MVLFFFCYFLIKTMNSVFSLRKKKTQSNTIFIRCSMNNTIASLIDFRGNLVYTISSGHLKFKGANKGSRVALQQVVSTIGWWALNRGYLKCLIKITGLGKGRNSIGQELVKIGLEVVGILDSTTIPFNGCRVKKGKR